MTPLERLGLEVAAFNLLGSRARASIVCALIEANGRIVTVEAIQALRPRHWTEQDTLSRRGLHARICWLREALEDIGLPGLIVTARDGRSTPADGYSLPEPGRTALIARLIEDAGTC